MKLYTEEQLRKAIDFFLSDETKKDKIIETLTPIELPDYKDQLDRIEKILLKEETAKRNRFKIGPL